MTKGTRKTIFGGLTKSGETAKFGKEGGRSPGPFVLVKLLQKPAAKSNQVRRNRGTMNKTHPPSFLLVCLYMWSK